MGCPGQSHRHRRAGAPDRFDDLSRNVLVQAVVAADHVRRLRHGHGIGYVTVFVPHMDATAGIIAPL